MLSSETALINSHQKQDKNNNQKTITGHNAT